MDFTGTYENSCNCKIKTQLCQNHVFYNFAPLLYVSVVILYDCAGLICRHGTAYTIGMHVFYYNHKSKFFKLHMLGGVKYLSFISSIARCVLGMFPRFNNLLIFFFIFLFYFLVNNSTIHVLHC